MQRAGLGCALINPARFALLISEPGARGLPQHSTHGHSASPGATAALLPFVHPKPALQGAARVCSTPRRKPRGLQSPGLALGRAQPRGCPAVPCPVPWAGSLAPRAPRAERIVPTKPADQEVPDGEEISTQDPPKDLP